LLADESKLAALGKFRDGFEELKYNKEEADAIGKYFDSEVIKGNEATEKVFLEKFKNFDILHFAMHALVDNEESDNSKLVFTHENDSVNDSFLHSFELYNMNMNPRLAVLSACNSGLGELKGGEGVMSLARAFTYAGAESVVMSHWRVNDQSSRDIMESFYKYLSQGENKDQALRLAKIEYLESAPANSQHPFHWNNFVVYGDVSPIRKPGSVLDYWWAVMLILTIAAIAIGIYKRKNRLLVSDKSV